MIAIVAQLTETQRAVADHFQEGGSILSMILVAVGIAMIVFLVYWLTRRQERARRADPIDEPQKLFRDLLGKLDLTVRQKSTLQMLAHDLELTNPSILLLSKKLFSQHMARWRQAADRTGKAAAGRLDEKVVAGIGQALFPEAGNPTVASTPHP